MVLLNNDELDIIIKNEFGIKYRIIQWKIEECLDKILGYLGDHLKLVIEVQKDEVEMMLYYFVKCMPRFDKWKKEYLTESKFFFKEFIMLNKLFQEFSNGQGSEKWRPKILFMREDLFVFEDVSKVGYKMPHNREVMPLPVLKAVIKTLARFHAQSYVFEERRSKDLGRPFRIWDDFGEYLQEPIKGQPWRDTGTNAVIELLKTFSKYKKKPDFSAKVESVVPLLFDTALSMMKPSTTYRNVVIHRDLWTNNIFIKREQNGELHALIVDFQTVVYASPMLDLSSLIYLNTSRTYREAHWEELVNIYYDTLSYILREVRLNIDDILSKGQLFKAYNDSLVFGITQASLIVPIVAMDDNKREEIFCDPQRSAKANVVSRSDEFIEIANEDYLYRDRICELLDEIVEKYIYLEENY